MNAHNASINQMMTFPGCWTEYPNTHSLKSQPDSAASLGACQDVCLNDESCEGIDWNPGLPGGEQCWLIGPWTTTRQVAISDITQYLINRENCGKFVHHTRGVTLVWKVGDQAQGA